MAPFRSEKQKKKLQQLVQDGKLSPATFSRMAQDTGSKKLPDRVSTKKPPEKKAKIKYK